MKPLIAYLTSVIRAVICGSVYLFWLSVSLSPSAIEVASGATKPLSYYITVPFSSCLCMMLTIVLLHHLITVPLNWVAAFFPNWVSTKFRPSKHWYWPAKDSWNEGYDAGIACLLGVLLSSFFYILGSVKVFEALSGEDKLKAVLGITVLVNPELANAIASLFGATSTVENPREFMVSHLSSAFDSDFRVVKISWLLFAASTYHYLNYDRTSETAPKSKSKAKKKTQAQVVDIDPVEQELNQLSAEMGTVKMNPVRKPKAKN